MVNSTLSGEPMLEMNIEFGLPTDRAYPSPMSPPSLMSIENERQRALLLHQLSRSKAAVTLLERALLRMNLSRPQAPSSMLDWINEELL